MPQAGSQQRRARCALVEIADPRERRGTEVGTWLRDELLRRGHEVVQVSAVGEDVGSVRTAVQTIVHGRRLDLVFTIGSAGVSARDCAVDAISPLVDAPMPGFGELLRSLAFEALGAEAMMWRAAAGRSGSTFVFCLPASAEAVRLAWERLVSPQLGNLLAAAGERR